MSYGVDVIDLPAVYSQRSQRLEWSQWLFLLLYPNAQMKLFIYLLLISCSYFFLSTKLLVLMAFKICKKYRKYTFIKRSVIWG